MSDDDTTPPTKQPQAGGMSEHHAAVQSSKPGNTRHVVRLTSRCNCAHNSARFLADHLAHAGWHSTVTFWRGDATLHATVQEFPPHLPMDWDELPY